MRTIAPFSSHTPLFCLSLSHKSTVPSNVASTLSLCQPSPSAVSLFLSLSSLSLSHFLVHSRILTLQVRALAMWDQGRRRAMMSLTDGGGLCADPSTASAATRHRSPLWASLQPCLLCFPLGPWWWWWCVCA